MLDQYFFGEMSDTELKDFHNILSNNTELMEAFQIRRLTLAALHRAEVQAFKTQYNTLNSPASSPISKLPAVQVLRDWKWPIAIGVALMIGLGFCLFFANSSSENLFKKYDIENFYPKLDYALVDTGNHHKAILEADRWEDLKKKGLEAFDNKDWDKAIELFTQYLSSIPVSEEMMPDEVNIINLYLGRAYIEKAETQKAINVLEKAKNRVSDLDNYALIKELMQWHLTLAYLKNNNKTAAKEQRKHYKMLVFQS